MIVIEAEKYPNPGSTTKKKEKKNRVNLTLWELHNSSKIWPTGNNSYMLLDNGSLACIGDNEYGQCNNDGVTTGTDQLTPIIMPDM